MKYAHIYALFLIAVFHTSCGQNQTNPPQDKIKSSRENYSDSVYKAANDGSIWFGSHDGVHRYDGKTITDFKSAAGQKECVLPTCYFPLIINQYMLP